VGQDTPLLTKEGQDTPPLTKVGQDTLLLTKEGLGVVVFSFPRGAWERENAIKLSRVGVQTFSFGRDW